MFRHRFFSRPVLIAWLVCAGSAWAGHATAVASPVSRSLTFTDRVACQYALEEVYWRHRIWPKDNPGSKPPLEVVLSQEQVERKVSDYLTKSEAIGGGSQGAITAAQLQAEMNRMARDTKEPAVLRELFAALGDDPFVIAECLARQTLADCFVNAFTRQSSVEGARRAHAPPPPMDLTWPVYRLPKISGARTGTDDTWTGTSNSDAPEARLLHTAVWTGSEMIVWGGFNFAPALGTGARYDPATDRWSATSVGNAPPGRDLHTAVWTGSEMIVWGGYEGGNDLNSGGKYNPAADSWTPTSTAGAPLGRESHTAVWTGIEMIVWGGLGCGGNCNQNTGGRYNPSTDSWIATSISNAPSARRDHTAVWTGSEMIIWSGTDAAVNSTYLHTGGRYNPATDSWRPTSLANVPLGRVSHAWVWTGREMIIWGGVDETFNDCNTGGKYNPATDSWMATGVANGAPTARDSHSAVWTGREMIIWGGTAYPGHDFNDGKRYDPGTDSWRPMTTVNAPFARAQHTAVWTGQEMIVWGGISYDTATVLNTGGIYSAQPSTPLVQSAVSQKTHGNAGTFDVDLPVSGAPGMECRNGGATGDYTLVVTFLANVSVDGNPQAAVTSGSGTIGSGGVSSGGIVVTSGNVVTIPLTNVANAQTIQVTLNNVNGSSSVTIPMRVLIGDVNGNGAVNASDVASIKARSGQPVDATTFRADVTADGSINATDVSLAKSLSGTALP